MATGLFGAPTGMRGTMLGGSYAPDTRPKPDAKKPGLFDMGGPARGIAGTIGDFLLQYNGMRPVYAPHQQAQQAAVAELRAASLDRDNDWQDWVKREQWKRDNPAPTNNDTVADYEFWRSKLTPEQFAQYVQNKVDPPVWREGRDGQFYRVDTGQAPTFTQEDWDNAGGGASNGTGGFR